MNKYIKDELRVRKRYEYKRNILSYECEKKDDILIKKQPCLISVSDISYGGLGIYCNKKLKRDMMLGIKVNNESVSRNFNLKVKWCKFNELTDNSSKFKVGLKFEDLTRDDIIFINEIIRKIK
ncbi:PilZ domain-containing protein [Helicovermis profundi]|uniref:PilZ domain-containing protein n=1 Tax=Helicovermis profundi TaxID=3065157 RepID=A0AAU9EJS2_9FIRM|nr:hypothetical protein HLPR_21690 [Clostridia bacterium S502]